MLREHRIKHNHLCLWKAKTANEAEFNLGLEGYIGKQNAEAKDTVSEKALREVCTVHTERDM